MKALIQRKTISAVGLFHFFYIIKKAAEKQPVTIAFNSYYLSIPITHQTISGIAFPEIVKSAQFGEIGYLYLDGARFQVETAGNYHIFPSHSGSSNYFPILCGQLDVSIKKQTRMITMRLSLPIDSATSQRLDKI